jgi:hypothetical protein
MKLLDTLERKLGGFALPHATLALLMGQVAVYVLSFTKPEVPERLLLIPNRVLGGEYWRLFSFLIVPPQMDIVFVFFFWFFLFLMGGALEQYWGSFRYNVFLFIGFVCTVAASFVEPAEATSATLLLSSVLLAFAHLCPDFQILLSFILPIRIKWLALSTWIIYAFVVVFGGTHQRMLVLASVGNFLLFFGRDLIARTGLTNKMELYLAAGPKPFHRCTICGVTDKTDPKMDFRYCTKCAGDCCYCSDHLHTHEHVLGADHAARA